MRIAHIVSTYPPYRGGMGNAAHAMVEGLAGRGHEVEVFTPAYGELADAPGRTSSVSPAVHRLKPLFSSGNAAFMPGLHRHLAGFDALHLHYPFFGGAESVAWFAYRHPQQRLIITYHMDAVGTGAKRLFFSAYREMLMPAILAQAAAVTVSSLDYASTGALADLSARLPLVELPFGVAERFKPAARPERGADQPLRLLFVGGLDTAHYFKGLHLLLMALQTLPLELRNRFTLDIVGDGDRRPAFAAQSAGAGLSGQIHFRGSLPDDELVKAYQQADLTVLPSVDRSEAFGLVLLESMACGTPVLATALPGVRTVVDAGKTGFLVEANNVDALRAQLVSCLAHPADVLAMRSAAHERVQAHYRWPGIISKLEALYQKA
ncbi:MAG: glycosyltransferase [Parcubacteria group bacterium]|nr:glycosyltransferase [Parcubacteria group bacterium]